MNKGTRDSAVKRGVPTPKTQSLHENMGLTKTPGYGDPHPPQDYLFDNIKGGKGKGQGPNVKTPGRSGDPGGVKTRKTGTTKPSRKK